MKRTSTMRQVSTAVVASLLLGAACSGDGVQQEPDEEYSPHEPAAELDNSPNNGAASESVSATVSISPEMLARSTVSLSDLRASLEQVTSAEAASDDQAELSTTEESDGPNLRGRLDPELLRFLIATRERMEGAQ